MAVLHEIQRSPENALESCKVRTVCSCAFVALITFKHNKNHVASADETGSG